MVDLVGALLGVVMGEGPGRGFQREQLISVVSRGRYVMGVAAHHREGDARCASLAACLSLSLSLSCPGAHRGLKASGSPRQLALAGRPGSPAGGKGRGARGGRERPALTGRVVAPCGRGPFAACGGRGVIRPGADLVGVGRWGVAMRVVGRPWEDWLVSGGRLAGLQRSRLAGGGDSRAVDELGYSDTSVADITTRARVSRRTFYGQFADREACLAVALEDALGVIRGELAAVDLEGCAWRERVRMGLWRILGFFDGEPVLARVCVVQALRGGPRVLERRGGDPRCRRTWLWWWMGVVRGRAGLRCTPLTAEGLVGAAFSIVYARLLKGDRRPLVELLGEMMAMIVLPCALGSCGSQSASRPSPACSYGVSCGAAAPGVAGN